ncbi:hypothetical protein COY07_02065 [Candidatus Peregrinibacteria bacterium CG_4_10_14_0_2_um_filter_43_11]|nr:MAG: hypothetical protein COY07_02065 [Candidatus Peregrinibacteria bacterium CG_4_10_14_0_2_um_filter_43_11]
MKQCTQCKSSFEVTDLDRQFYDKLSPIVAGKKYPLPEPVFCPQCRCHRRITFRNERHLYHRKCDLCWQSKILCYPADSPYTVYCHECWLSDKWDASNYGLEFDFSRPFFEQFDELMKSVPKMGMMQFNNENSPYANWLAYSKNSMMSPGSYYVDTCLYGRKNQNSRDIVDCVNCDHCDLLYSSINCNQCYQSQHLLNCRNCSECFYVANSTRCKNCFMCSDLVGKEYHINNQPCSKEDYERRVSAKMKLSPVDLMQGFSTFSGSTPKRFQNQINCQDSLGDYIQNCKNATFCFDCFDVEDSRYLYDCVTVKDSMDLTNFDEKIERCYEISAGGDRCQRVLCSFCPIICSDSLYLHVCLYAQNCFGCDGIHQKTSYSILNKKYSKEEYEQLVPKIIEHMNKTGEWGIYFSPSISPFSYNETFANELSTLSKEEVLARGWKWRDLKDHLQDVQKTISANRLPHSIANIPDDILNWAIVCEKTGRPFKVQPAELKFYRKMNIPVPHCHPDQRYLDLVHLRNPRHLYSRKCAKCQSEIQTTYPPERPETVYCESCYLSSIY